MSGGALQVRDASRTYSVKAQSPNLLTGYKQTEVGLIPENWDCVPVVSVARLESGHTPSRRESSYWDGKIAWVSLHDTDSLDGRTITDTALTITEKGLENSSARLLPEGTVIFSRTATIGKCTVLGREMCTSQDYANYICGPLLNNDFLVYLFRSMTRRWQSFMAGSTHNTIYMPVFKALKIQLPPVQEQRAIAEALSDMDDLIGALEALIAKKRAINQGAMQQLLTGKTRLPGFEGHWETRKIAEFATLRNEKHDLAENLPVLTCSKHFGFVDSLRYFRNQVFSKDLSSYKVIKRGDIGYPANHIEEGSIGLQNLYDVALVSPIYVVCVPNRNVNSYFLQRLLKLDSYRQEFATATTSSVDRRGSLKWPAFSEILVTLPPTDEQTAIVAVLSDMDAEIEALEKRCDKTREIKQGMMQQLLTGRIRLVKPEVVDKEAAA